MLNRANSMIRDLQSRVHKPLFVVADETTIDTV